jgi:hypothetical protein
MYIHGNVFVESAVKILFHELKWHLLPALIWGAFGRTLALDVAVLVERICGGAETILEKVKCP